MATHGVAGGGPQGWLSLWRGGEGRGGSLPQSPSPSPSSPLRLAAPLPLCCTLASARWIFLAVPILLPPVRAVLEPAKWLSFKPRAAGRAVAKPRCPPHSPPLLQQQQLGLQVILSPAVSRAAPSPSHYAPTLAPTSPLQPPPGFPSPQPPWPGCREGHRQGHSYQPLTPCLPPTHSPDSPSPSPPHFSWDSPTSCSPEPSPELQTGELRLGSVAGKSQEVSRSTR